ncbi:MAG TPA: TIM barrel protein [Spirochaetota bacterium]|nr:TIM barrel protein [Spirochaetota bacterium]HPP04367.1 TIM barrel protein [Spirochaetota bacterium]
MFKNGLKLWSINKNYIKNAIKIYENRIFDYIELFTVPDSYSYLKYWQNLNIPFVIHGPHFGNGLNFSKKELFDSNIKMAKDTIRWADSLHSNYIIFHPGVDGDIYETIREINFLNDKRILIENKPYLGKGNDLRCIGNSVEEIKLILTECNIGFCFDIGHSICAANFYKINPIENIKNFIKLNPVIYHFTDGYYDSVYDEHLHFGEGNYPLKEIINLIPNNSMVTNEAKKRYKNSLSDFIKDMNYIKKFLN